MRLVSFCPKELRPREAKAKITQGGQNCSDRLLPTSADYRVRDVAGLGDGRCVFCFGDGSDIGAGGVRLPRRF